MANEHGLLARWALVLAASADNRLSRTDIAVMMAILDRLNADGLAWPGLSTVASDAKADRSTVTRSISRLTEWGYLLRDSGNRTRSNRYRMGASPRCEPAPRCEFAARCEPAPGVGANSHLEVGVDPHPEPASLNLPIEPTQSNPGNRFADFYRVYPRSEAKAAAEKAWKAKRLDGIAATIIADVVASNAGRWKGKEKQFVPLPATYLNQRRWEDEWQTSGSQRVSRLPRDSRCDDDIASANEAAFQQLQGVAA